MLQEHIHFSTELEQAVIGACLLEKTAIGRTYGIIDSSVFNNENLRKFYENIHEMFEQGIPIDLLTVADYMLNKKKVDFLPPNQLCYELTRTTNAVVSTANLEYHSFILKRMWIERRIIYITHGGLKLEGDLRSQLGQLYLELNTLNNFSIKKDWEDMEDLMIGLYKHMDEMKQTGGVGVPMGIKVLDKSNGGFHPGQMIILGARPSVGKSAFIGQMALYMARKNYKVGIISLEMSNREIAARLASIDTDTDFNLIYRNLLHDERQQEILYNKISQSTSKLPIYVTDKTDVNINEIRAKASKLVTKKSMDFLIIDYLQLVTPQEGKSKSRENEVSEISRGCKIMAKELNIPVMVLCQLNREVTKRKGNDRYPRAEDLRESGSLEQDADIIMFLHRDWMLGEPYTVKENGDSTQREADLIIRKWRNGEPNLRVELEFDPPKMKFKEKTGFNSLPPEGFRPLLPEEKDVI